MFSKPRQDVPSPDLLRLTVYAAKALLPVLLVRAALLFWVWPISKDAFASFLSVVGNDLPGLQNLLPLQIHGERGLTAIYTLFTTFPLALLAGALLLLNDIYRSKERLKRASRLALCVSALVSAALAAGLLWLLFGAHASSVAAYFFIGYMGPLWVVILPMCVGIFTAFALSSVYFLANKNSRTTG